MKKNYQKEIHKWNLGKPIMFLEELSNCLAIMFPTLKTNSDDFKIFLLQTSDGRQRLLVHVRGHHLEENSWKSLNLFL